METHGLYSMPRYSYEWPSWEVCLWALLVGPLAGLSAASFRRFIKFVEGALSGLLVAFKWLLVAFRWRLGGLNRAFRMVFARFLLVFKGFWALRGCSQLVWRKSPGYKPLGRFPVEFQSVKLHDEVWLTRDKDGYITRAPRLLHRFRGISRRFEPFRAVSSGFVLFWVVFEPLRAIFKG